MPTLRRFEIESLVKNEMEKKTDGGSDTSEGELMIPHHTYFQAKEIGLLKAFCVFLLSSIPIFLVMYWHIHSEFQSKLDDLRSRSVLWYRINGEVQWDEYRLFQAMQKSSTLLSWIHASACPNIVQGEGASSCSKICEGVNWYLDARQCRDNRCLAMEKVNTSSSMDTVDRTRKDCPPNPECIGSSESKGTLNECPKINKISCEHVVGSLVKKTRGCPDVFLKCPRIDCRAAVEITSARKYLTDDVCWKSSFEGRFSWREGIDPPTKWAPDDPLSVFCEGKACGPVGEWRHTYRLPNRTDVRAKRMYQWRFETDCGIRSFLVNKEDRDACLKDKTILIVGDSTIRQMFRLITNTVMGRKDEDINVFECDPLEASGCYDCYCGCKSEKMDMHKNDWRDQETYFQKLNLTIHFSWKPNIFTLDDRIMLDRYRRGEIPRPDVVIIHKSSHDAFQRRENYPAWINTDWKNYIVGRSEQMVEAYDEAFADVPVFWRAPFYREYTKPTDALNILMRSIEEVTRPHLVQHNIRILETYTILDEARGAPELFDKMHPYEFVNFVLLDAVLSTICKHVDR